MSLQLENGGGHVQVPRSLMQAFLRQDPNQPGVETVRLPNPTLGDEGNPPNSSCCREVETEMCLVCRRCGRAYPQESALLAHQRSCYLGNQQRRGALRLVQSRYSCTICDTSTSTRTYGSIAEWRRHSETLQHRARFEAGQQQQRQLNNSGNNIIVGNSTLDHEESKSEEINPLVDEMEDVVNQITLLAAKAAAESSASGILTQPQQNVNNQDNNNGPEAKRQKVGQEMAALTGAR